MMIGENSPNLNSGLAWVSGNDIYATTILPMNWMTRLRNGQVDPSTGEVCSPAGWNPSRPDVADPLLQQPVVLPGLQELPSRRRNFGFSDGSVKFLKQSINVRAYMGLSTRAGGEVISADSVLRRLAGGQLMRYRSLHGMSACGLCALAGCGPDNGLTMGRVSGVVTYKGEPVEFGDILFVPDDVEGEQGRPLDGQDRQGRPVHHVDAGLGRRRDRRLSQGRHPRPRSRTGLQGRGARGRMPNAPAGQDGMKGRIQQRKAMAQSLRKNRAKQDAPTVSFNGKAYRFLVPRSGRPETSGIRVEISTGSNRVDFAFNEDGTVKINK